MRYAELVEARQAPLYHFMSFAKAMEVLPSNAMPGRWKHRIGDREILGNSFTRNPNLNWSDSTVRLTVDQARLAMNHRIMPLDGELAFSHTFGHGWERVSHMRDRIKNSEVRSKTNRSPNYTLSEEFVVGDIKNLSKYVTEIYFFSGRFVMTGAEAVDLFEEIKRYSEQHSIPVKVSPKMEAFIQETLAYWATPDEDR